MVIGLALGAALFFFLTVFFLLAYFSRRELNFHRRIMRYQDEDYRNNEDKDLWEQCKLFVRRMARPVARWQISRKLDNRMWQAGWPLLGAEFMVIIFLAFVGVMLLTYLLTLNFLLALLCGGLAVAGGWGVMMYRVRERQRLFMEQLGDCLITVANALRAGYSFPQAVDVVAREMEPPLSLEFAHMARDMAMGIKLETAMEEASQRLESADFDLMMTAVLVQREVGGNLAQILDTISETIMERIRMKRETISLTAQGRFSAWILLALPFILAAFMFIVNRDQLMLLFTEPMGRIAVAVSLVLEFMGYLAIRRIVDIKA
ncbi:MAG: type II secretion system F family protein [Selenomonas sp.]|uniref:type II secretion system F family protein n=1 Tax=Selenomonas sp. TaxID=2053611 RepID=UPI0025D7A1AF|nr:type II secretion system F family protein [Selenomonas sp.]MCR5757742.1 type II secretion system F family protein [Selenomonas sp.]